MAKKKTRNKPSNLKHRVSVRFTDEEFAFLLSLKEKGLKMSDFLRTSMLMTERYRKFVKLIDGGFDAQEIITLAREKDGRYKENHRQNGTVPEEHEPEETREPKQPEPSELTGFGF